MLPRSGGVKVVYNKRWWVVHNIQSTQSKGEGFYDQYNF